MNDYRELRINITPCCEDGTDIMAALLADAGFESFVPDDKGLTAYVRVEDYDPVKVNDALGQYPFAARLDLESRVIEGRDWNAEWERNYFKPIVVDDRVAIHATFHDNVPTATHDIVIDPKMAFGTGHHATTAGVIRALLANPPAGQYVIDMGTGTGILAILAAMLGAKKVTAVEIDAFAHANALENLALNHVDNIVDMVLGDATAINGINQQARMLLANINRNVILSDIATYAHALAPGGLMILSGFYTRDIEAVVTAAAPHGLTLQSHSATDDWACLILKKDRA